jgi:hypothetical protein
MNTRAIVAEFVGTAMLLLAVVGSGIMAQRLAGGNVAIALLANTIATGGALIAIILAFGPISSAHLTQPLPSSMPGTTASRGAKSRPMSAHSSSAPCSVSRLRM